LTTIEKSVQRAEIYWNQLFLAPRAGC